MGFLARLVCPSETALRHPPLVSKVLLLSISRLSNQEAVQEALETAELPLFRMPNQEISVQLG